ncbi:Na+/H+ antiporter subunit E [Suttonella sp. R2A3]|uniref:Na+/H+ antiporter subunit E n=1 Tax=Suttonella sp. R2A3 TaxID=2908648 RepID=UPI001F31806D|nr:Na+/H+ antiporter subunit E [Suttonella sp. R2A3]UJF24028.1 Na+/H+ antiporter subunit E [Suttonella sp. R2A3]
MQRLHRFKASVQLIINFFEVLIASGVGTLVIILRYWRPKRDYPPTAFVRLEVSPMDDIGMSLLAAMITLTPGTTTIDIDQDNHELLLHVLDARDLDEVIATIQRKFIPSLWALFAEEETDE